MEQRCCFTTRELENVPFWIRHRRGRSLSERNLHFGITARRSRIDCGHNYFNRSGVEWATAGFPEPQTRSSCLSDSADNAYSCQWSAEPRNLHPQQLLSVHHWQGGPIRVQL